MTRVKHSLRDARRRQPVCARKAPTAFGTEAMPFWLTDWSLISWHFRGDVDHAPSSSIVREPARLFPMCRCLIRRIRDMPIYPHVFLIYYQGSSTETPNDPP